jgi:hypothetical protein
MEGRRLATQPRVVDAKHADVARAYRSALAFVESLIERGGLGTLGFAVRETGETGDLNKGFLSAYALDYDALRAEGPGPAGSAP